MPSIGGALRDRRPEIREHGPAISKLLTGMLLDITGGRLEGCAKASVVSMGGEIEHAQAITHMPHFGNQFRKASNAKSCLAFANTRGAANCPMTIPLMDKEDNGRRSHYQTIQTSIADVPVEDEIIVALGASIGGYPNHRIGDLNEYLAEIGRDVGNPAVV